MRSDTEETDNAERSLGVPLDDPERLRALRHAQLLDTPAEEAFDRLTQLARALLHAPVALISLVDTHRQFFKSQQGLPEPWASMRETPLSHSFCQHVVTSDKPLVVPNAYEMPLVAQNAAIRDLNVIAYLGVPLRDPDGHVFGSLCVIDDKPRDWSDSDVAVLTDLSRTVMTEVFLRQVLHQQIQTEAELRASEAKNGLLLRELRHRVRNSLAIIQSLVRQSLRTADTPRQAANAIEGRLSALGRAHEFLSADHQPLTSLRALLEASIAPFRRNASTFHVQGEDVILPSDLALMLSLALHELATNAVKHGALTVPDGRIHISWHLRNPPDEAARLDLTWIEQDGPLVRPPSRKGFGSQLIKRSAQAQNADVSLDFAEDGLRCTISAPFLDELPVALS